MSGTSTLEVYDASILAAEANLIVTSMQYRSVHHAIQYSTCTPIGYHVQVITFIPFCLLGGITDHSITNLKKNIF